MRYDIAIVGGGPAGAMAGINLIGSGLRVVILDRSRFPRLKPCGGGISCRVFKRFRYLETVLRSVPTHFVSTVMFESPYGAVAEIKAPQPLYAMVRRVEFDHALLDHCKLGGIDVRESMTVSRIALNEDGVNLTCSSGEEFVADLVIGADGVNSAVAVQTQLRGPWHASQLAIDGTEESLLFDVNVRQDTMYIYYGMHGGYGYGYVFPKTCHVNFGVGYSLDYCKRNISDKPYDQHLRFLEQLQQVGVISGKSQRQNFHAYVLPWAGPMEKISANRVLLAGDAAGFVNGFTAEGIYYAMLSGEHAGKTALEAVKSRNFSAKFLRRYDAACETEVGRELRNSIMIQKRLLSNHKLIHSIVRIASRNQAMRTLLTRFVVGELSYEETKKRAMVEALPGYLSYKAAKLWLEWKTWAARSKAFNS